MQLNAATLTELFESEGPRLLTFATRRTFDVDAAFDVVGETFAVAFERRRTFRGTSDGEAAAWLLMICRTVLDHAQRRGSAERRALQRLGVERPLLGEDERRRVEELARLDDLRPVLEAALGELPDEQQVAVKLSVIDDLDYDDVARRLNITTTTARARVSRALRALATTLDAQEFLDVR